MGLAGHKILRPSLSWHHLAVSLVTWHTVHCSTGKERRTIVLAKPGGLNNWRIVTVACSTVRAKFGGVEARFWALL